MQGYPPNQPPGGGYPPGPPPGGGSPYGYGAPPPAPGYGPQGYGPPGYPGAPMMTHAPYGIEPTTGLPYSEKTKVLAGVLQLLLPGFGAGRFYTGHTGIAVAQLLVSMFTCVGVIWPIVDGIMMLTGKVTDSDGRPLRNG